MLHGVAGGSVQLLACPPRDHARSNRLGLPDGLLGVMEVHRALGIRSRWRYGFYDSRRGKTLRCLSAAFTGATQISRAWLRNGRAIKGATRTTYKLSRSDAGTSVACRITGANVAGSVAVTSAGVRVRR